MTEDLERQAEEAVSVWLEACGWTFKEEAGCWWHPKHGERWSAFHAAAAQHEG